MQPGNPEDSHDKSYNPFSEDEHITKEEDLNLLARSFELNSGYQFCVGVTEKNRVQEVTNFLKGKLPDHSIEEAAFPSNLDMMPRWYLEYYIEKHFPDWKMENRGKNIIVINGLPQPTDEIPRLDEEYMVRLNANRDGMGQNLPCSLLFLLNNDQLVKLIHNAPDFWSTRGYVAMDLDQEETSRANGL